MVHFISSIFVDIEDKQDDNVKYANVSWDSSKDTSNPIDVWGKFDYFGPSPLLFGITLGYFIILFHRFLFLRFMIKLKINNIIILKMVK